jgi:hypothetical protein
VIPQAEQLVQTAKTRAYDQGVEFGCPGGFAGLEILHVIHPSLPVGGDSNHWRTGVQAVEPA